MAHMSVMVVVGADRPALRMREKAHGEIEGFDLGFGVGVSADLYILVFFLFIFSVDCLLIILCPFFFFLCMKMPLFFSFSPTIGRDPEVHARNPRNQFMYCLHSTQLARKEWYNLFGNSDRPNEREH